MAGQPKSRNTCTKMLDTKNEWALDYQATIGRSTVRQEIIKEIGVHREYDINREFVEFFLKTKYSVHEKNEN